MNASNADRQATFERTPWHLERGIAIPDGVTVTARFAGGTVAGQGPVNRYRAEYLPRLRPFLEKYGAEVLVAGFDAEPAGGRRRTAPSCSASPMAPRPGPCSTTRSISR